MTVEMGGIDISESARSPQIRQKGGSMSRTVAPFTDEMKTWMKCVVRNASRKEIFAEVFGADLDTISEQEANRYDVKLCRWRKHPDYQKEWLNAFKSQWNGILADAVAVVQEGLHDESIPWRRTQHANLALAYGTKLIVGEEERTVHVQIEGMPDIGSPDS